VGVNAHANANADEEAAQWKAARDGRQRRSQWTGGAIAMDGGNAIGQRRMSGGTR